MQSIVISQLWRHTRLSLTEEMANVVAVLLFSHELTMPTHCTLTCHLSNLTSCCLYKTHLQALWISLENWTTCSRLFGDDIGYRSVNVSISRSHYWPIQFIIQVSLNLLIRYWWITYHLDHYGLLVVPQTKLSFIFRALSVVAQNHLKILPLVIINFKNNVNI